jgi:hypothetical protein
VSPIELGVTTVATLQFCSKSQTISLESPDNWENNKNNNKKKASKQTNKQNPCDFPI